MFFVTSKIIRDGGDYACIVIELCYVFNEFLIIIELFGKYLQLVFLSKKSILNGAKYKYILKNSMLYRIDIAEGIPKKGQLFKCMKCNRFLQPPSRWLHAELESKELMAVCLKRLPGLSKVHLVDANFSWSEPHSKRVKIWLKVRKQVLEKELLEQTFEIEFTVIGQICEECQRIEAKDFWNAVVQVRQKIDHKRTIYYLEQILLAKKVHQDASSIEQRDNGLDFFFSSETAARKFISIIEVLVPMRYSASKSLISHDAHSNTYNYKYVFAADVVPLCKDCIVCLPKSVHLKFSSIGPICLVYKVTKMIYLIDPNTMKTAVVSPSEYYRNSFSALSSIYQMKRFLVMDVSPINQSNSLDSRKLCHRSCRKFLHADVWLVKDDDTAFDEEQIHCRTHLGHILNAGDYVMGYDLSHLNSNDYNFELLDECDTPSVVIVRKVYEKSKRKWKLARLFDDNTDAANTQFSDFMEDIEDDPEIRKDITIYKDDPDDGHALNVNELADIFKNIDLTDSEMDE
ncbi:hypothetical protein GJ496_001468 [Pomphorhynchus laevis]|nr:hypothetical protein GJ496_001468 [Pomphorhynchus laevis]